MASPAWYSNIGKNLHGKHSLNANDHDSAFYWRGHCSIKVTRKCFTARWSPMCYIRTLFLSILQLKNSLTGGYESSYLRQFLVLWSQSSVTVRLVRSHSNCLHVVAGGGVRHSDWGPSDGNFSSQVSRLAHAGEVTSEQAEPVVRPYVRKISRHYRQVLPDLSGYISCLDRESSHLDTIIRSPNILYYISYMTFLIFN